MVVVDRKVSWYEAQEFCKLRNAYLTDMPDIAEREAVWRYVKGGNLDLIFFMKKFTLSQQHDEESGKLDSTVLSNREPLEPDERVNVLNVLCSPICTMFACSCTSAFCGCVGVDIMHSDKDKDCTNLMRTTLGKILASDGKSNYPIQKLLYHLGNGVPNTKSR